MVAIPKPEPVQPDYEASSYILSRLVDVTGKVLDELSDEQREGPLGELLAAWQQVGRSGLAVADAVSKERAAN